MSKTTIATLPDPFGFSPDPLTGVIRDGARKLIEQAIEAELAALIAGFAEDKLEDGRARLVRHGHLPEREVLTGIGPVAVKVPRVRDRSTGTDKITFTPSILPRYLRKARSVEELLPWLYLKGVSTGDFSEALAALLGQNAKGLSAKTISFSAGVSPALFAARRSLTPARLTAALPSAATMLLLLRERGCFTMRPNAESEPGHRQPRSHNFC